MIGASTLSGDTLIACHFPVVQLPTWQLPVRALCSSSKRPSRLCSAGLTRAVSLPEKDSLNREHPFVGGRRHFSSSYSSLNEDRVEEEGGSDSSGRYDSTSSPEEMSSHLKERTRGSGGNLCSRNSFLPNTELDEDEEDEDSDGGNLHRYHEDSSFVLHGNSNWPLNNDSKLYALPSGDVGSDWGNEGTMLAADGEWSHLDLKSECLCCNGSRTGIEAYGEQNSVGLKENISCCIQSQHNSPELFSNRHTEYVSDSSCNSSDGVLVNFCTIYNRSNNPATPHDLSSPAVRPSQSSEGSVYLNLQPFSKTPAEDVQHDGVTFYSPPKQEADPMPSASCWSPHGLDSNCNLYSLEPLPAGLSSLEVSDLTACLQSQATLAIGTNQKYYKLVTCDLSSQSPSPAHSSVTGCLDGQNRSSPFPNSEQLLVDAKTGQQNDVIKQFCVSRKSETHGTQHTSGCCKPQAQHLGCLLEQYMNQKSSKAASSQPGFKFKGKRSQCFSNLQVSPMGSHYPVFLEAPSSSDTCSTCTPSPECFSRRHTWSQCNRSQAHSSPRISKSCLATTYTSPNPILVQDTMSLNSAKNQAKTFLNNTCQDIVDLTPEQSHIEHRNETDTSHYSAFSPTLPTLTLTTDTHLPNLKASLSPPPTSTQSEKKSSQDQADSVFFHNSFTAALFSVAPLSTLSSLLSSAASGLRSQHLQDFAGLSGKASVSQHSESLILSDKPPTEFCLSPDTSYESMSISHLQRRGLLRSVSRAVDLITAHFGSSRDPEEKMRLGNSSRSPTIAGLVLEHLCPAIQKILEDGLKDHKLDLIVGQQRNHCWSVVEVSTKIGPSTRVLHSLVSKITLFPQLSSPCMRLRAFIMGLLNLRALEFWLSHLQSQRDVVSACYHSWGFLWMSHDQCQSMFQELLLLLQPLSVMPFDLNLLLEPRLLENKQLCSEEESAFSPSPCSAHLVTSWPLLQADKKLASNYSSRQTKTSNQPIRHHQDKCIKEDCNAVQVSGSPLLAPIPEWRPMESDVIDDLKREDHSQSSTSTLSQISMHSRQEERKEEKYMRPNASTFVQEDGSPRQGWPRWAKLFGAGNTFTGTKRVSQSHTEEQTRRYKPPSHWLHLNSSQLGVLAQSIKSMKLRGVH
ncbi:AP-4 complex accessory subunit RUSC2 [Antennarius striatus]|uniref:AP-4 complex accessory subunit RUSC2 n=1 Tax=Antennarius striatus TaxID=241820 RepID=UPI0035AE34B8